LNQYRGEQAYEPLLCSPFQLGVEGIQGAVHC
jgi:hypothetical protein